MSAGTTLGARWRKRIVIPVVIAGLICGMVVGFGLVYYVYLDQRARDLITWQVRMGAAAEGQALEVGNWVNQRFATLNSLAINAALQIYVAQISQSKGDQDQVTAAAAQRQYLRNLLTVEAERGGFIDRSRTSENFSNVRRAGHAGLGILDADRRLLVSTEDMPPIEGALAKRLAGMPVSQRTLLEPFSLADESLAVGFIEPIYAAGQRIFGENRDANAQPRPDQMVGYVLGVLTLGPDFFAMLNLKIPYAPTAMSTLVQRSDNMIVYLYASDGASRERRLSNATPELDTLFAAERPGGFAEKSDYQGMRVLVTGRSVANTPWTIVHTVSAEAAMAETKARAVRNAIFLFLAALLALAAVVIAWRYGVSRHLSALADQYQALADRYNGLWQRHQRITDSQLEPIFVVDAEGRAKFANHAFMEKIGIDSNDIVGKHLNALLGPAAAIPIMDAVTRCLAKQGPVVLIQHESVAGKDRVIQTTFSPYEDEGSPNAAALAVTVDISAPIQERDQKIKMFNQLVGSISSAVDRRDPYSVRHSELVAAVSRGTAEQLRLDNKLVAAAELLGRLMNFGKLGVDGSTLTTPELIDSKVRDEIRKSMATVADIFSGVEFDGPVVPAMRCLQERWDGAGPLGMKGQEIPLLSQIAAAANFFVAVASPRSYREGGGLSSAVTAIDKETNKAFDSHVVTALKNFILNQGGDRLFINAAA